MRKQEVKVILSHLKLGKEVMQRRSRKKENFQQVGFSRNHLLYTFARSARCMSWNNVAAVDSKKRRKTVLTGQKSQSQSCWKEWESFQVQVTLKVINMWMDWVSANVQTQSCSGVRQVPESVTHQKWRLASTKRAQFFHTDHQLRQRAESGLNKTCHRSEEAGSGSGKKAVLLRVEIRTNCKWSRWILIYLRALIQSLFIRGFYKILTWAWIFFKLRNQDGTKAKRS